MNCEDRVEWGVKLEGAEIEIVCISLTAADDDFASLRDSLTGEELAKAARLVSAVKQRRSIAARGELRHALGRRLGLAARDVQLEREADGKPVLAGAQRGALHFNLSHSGDVAVLAMTETAAVGIDIEPLRDINPNIADAILGPAERAAWNACDPSLQPAQLLARWTLKEAALKAVGCGFQQAASALDMGAFGGDAPVTVSTDPIGVRGRVTARNLHDLWPGHVAGLAVIHQ